MTIGRRRSLGLGCAPLALALALFAAPVAFAAGAVEPIPGDLTVVSLEELSQIKVTSVAKKQQSLIRAAAAVYVITADDIRRSGATRIPEALRMAPGLEVSQIDANQWAVSARGFNGRFANKLLVMIDGRTIYNTFFSGVYWDLQDVPMEEVERIEVIRGPGATMWGANAVNGVINIITKAARESQGGLLQASLGSRGGPQSTVRYGGTAAGGNFRVYGRFQDRRPSPNSIGRPLDMDGMGTVRGGFRYDVSLSDRDELRVDADLHHNEGRQGLISVSPVPPVQSFSSTEMTATAGHLLGRWRRKVSDRSDFTFQVFYDVMDRDETVLHGYTSKTTDLEFQHRFRHAARAELNWGLEYRAVHASLASGRLVQSPRDEDRLNFVSGFLQEELELRPDELFVTFGTKLEQSTLGGFQPQPSARVLWSPSAETSLWGAVSMAVRAPSWGERYTGFDGAGLEGPFGLNVVAAVVPSPDLQNEKLSAYEAGLRLKPHAVVSLDLSTFYNRYRDLRSLGQSELEFRADPVRYLYLPIRFNNANCADSYGLELSSKWRLSDRWRLTANHSYLKIRFKAAQAGLIEELDYLQSPTHRTSALSSWDIGRKMQFDVAGYFVGRAIAGGFVRRGELIPAHVRADIRWQWKPDSKTQIELGVQNLFDPNRIEFEPETFIQGAPVGRNVYGRITWSF